MFEAIVSVLRDSRPYGRSYPLHLPNTLGQNKISLLSRFVSSVSNTLI